MKNSRLFLLCLLVSLNSFAFADENVDTCNPDGAKVILQEYYGVGNPQITPSDIQKANAIIGKVNTELEYILKYKLSYLSTCADQRTPGKPKNLTMSINLNADLECLLASDSGLVIRFVQWLNGNGCYRALDRSY